MGELNIFDISVDLDVSGITTNSKGKLLELNGKVIGTLNYEQNLDYSQLLLGSYINDQFKLFARYNLLRLNSLFLYEFSVNKNLNNNGLLSFNGTYKNLSNIDSFYSNKLSLLFGLSIPSLKKINRVSNEDEVFEFLEKISLDDLLVVSNFNNNDKNNNSSSVSMELFRSNGSSV